MLLSQRSSSLPARPLRIGIDAHILGKKRGGVETCVQNLVLSLAEMDRFHQYVVYVGDGHTLPASLPPNFELKRLPQLPLPVQRFLWLPYVSVRDRLDVLHVQRVAPSFSRARVVVHLHDAIQAQLPDLIPPLKRALLTRLFRASGERAWRVVTPSETSRQDIARAYSIALEKIFVVPNGIDHSFFYPEPDRAACEAAANGCGITGPYVLYLGAVERHKNVHVLVDAFAKVASRHPDLRLLVAGKWRAETQGGYLDELRENVKRQGLYERIRFVGHVRRESARLLLNGASMFAFPSAAEGFGLPPLEAMACGVPAIVTDSRVFRETCGDAALFVEPNSASSLAEHISAVASSAVLARELREKGLAWAAQYRWKRSAERLLAVYAAAGAGESVSAAI